MEVPQPPIPQPQLNTPALQLASKDRRFGNYFIDGIILYIFDIFILYVVNAPNLTLPIYLLTYFAYYILFENYTGKTIGKICTGTKVVQEDGTPLDLGKAFMRTLIRIVPFEPFSFLFGSNPTGWHDRWSKTRVIKDK